MLLHVHQDYRPHTDCGGNKHNDRAGTLLVYLGDVEEGGETSFPVLGISVKPKRGRAVMFGSLDSEGRCLPQSSSLPAPPQSGLHARYVL